VGRWRAAVAQPAHDIGVIRDILDLDKQFHYTRLTWMKIEGAVVIRVNLLVAVQRMIASFDVYVKTP
jgi:hypothetical protein